MGCIEYESYYLKETEWRALLAGIGIRAWYGICSETGEIEGTMENRHRILADLYQKNVLDWENGRAVIRQPFSSWFDLLQKSSSCIVIKKETDGWPLRCCYIGVRGVVITEKSQREKDMLCIFSLSKKDFLSFVLEIAAASEEDFAEGGEMLSLQWKDCRNGRLKSELLFKERGGRTLIPYGLRHLEEDLKNWLYEEDEG